MNKRKLTKVPANHEDGDAEDGSTDGSSAGSSDHGSTDPDRDFIPDFVDVEWADGSHYDDDVIAQSGSDDDDIEDTEQVNVNFGELVLDDQVQLAVKNRTVKKMDYCNRLTDEFKLLMGEANLCLAKGERATASNICLEIIRNIPESPAPYETLSIICEEDNDLYRSLQYGLISAHLWPADPHKWYGLAQKCMELNDTANCKICMGKALRYSHLAKDKAFIEEIISYFVKDCDTLDEDTAMKLVIGYKKLIKVSCDKEELRELIDNFKKSCQKLNKLELWARVVIPFCVAYPEEWNVKHIEKICVIYLDLKMYTHIIKLLTQSKYLVGADVQSGDIGAGVTLTSPSYSLPESVSPWIRATLVATLVYMGHDSFNIDELVTPLYTLLDPNTIGPELLLVADAYFYKSNIPAAFPVYQMLGSSCHAVHSHTWTRLGECYEQKGDWKEAVKSYEYVLSFDTSNTTAKLKLFDLQREHLAENEDDFSVNIHANPANIKDLSGRPDVVKLSYHRSQQLVRAGECQAAFEEGYSVLMGAFEEGIEFVTYRQGKKEELKGQWTSIAAANHLRYVQKHTIKSCKEHYEKFKDMLSKEEWYDWYIAMLTSCLATDNKHKGFAMALAAMSTRVIDVQGVLKNIAVHCIYLAAVLDHSDYLSEAIGQLLYSNPDTPGIWNLFYTIRHRLPHYRLQRLGVRWLFRNKGNFNGLFVNAQNTYHSRNYRACVAFFRQLLAQQPNNPHIYFYLSLLYLHFACSKSIEFTQRRHEIVIQAIACIFTYHKLKGPCQETLYNIGRCYHHLGLYQHALTYYEKALHAAPSDSMTGVENVDMKHETVYNMCHIYTACGSKHLARQLLYQHAVV